MADDGPIKHLLSDEYEDFKEKVLIENAFDETTRPGHVLRTLQLALTPTKLITGGRRRLLDASNMSCYCPELLQLYPLHAVRLQVFKRTSKQVLKMSVTDKCRYFRLRDVPKKVVYWNMWCMFLWRLNKDQTSWIYPFYSCTKLQDPYKYQEGEPLIRRCWKDKYLYLGTKRALENEMNCPVPIPGLGLIGRDSPLRTYSYILPQGSSMAVMGQREELEVCRDYDVCTTYTGEPTFNITYTPIMTAVYSGNEVIFEEQCKGLLTQHITCLLYMTMFAGFVISLVYSLAISHIFTFYCKAMAVKLVCSMSNETIVMYNKTKT